MNLPTLAGTDYEGPLGATWGPLAGPQDLGPLGGHLGATWGPLGGHLGATWGPLGRHLGATGPMAIRDSGHTGALLGCPRAFGGGSFGTLVSVVLASSEDWDPCTAGSPQMGLVVHIT